MLRFEYEQKRCKGVHDYCGSWQLGTSLEMYTLCRTSSKVRACGAHCSDKEGIINHTPPGGEGRSRLAIL